MQNVTWYFCFPRIRYMHARNQNPCAWKYYHIPATENITRMEWWKKQKITWKPATILSIHNHKTHWRYSIFFQNLKTIWHPKEEFKEKKKRNIFTKEWKKYNKLVHRNTLHTENTPTPYPDLILSYLIQYIDAVKQRMDKEIEIMIKYVKDNRSGYHTFEK